MTAAAASFPVPDARTMEECVRQWYHQGPAAAAAAAAAPAVRAGPPPTPRKPRTSASFYQTRGCETVVKQDLPMIVFGTSQPSLDGQKVSTHEVLGRGSYGVVYNVSLSNGSEMALKEQPMPSDLLGAKRLAILHYMKKRVCEVTTLATSPASLVACRRVWWEDNKLHTLMSLCPGVSTRTYVEKAHGMFTEKHAWQLLVDVCRALAHLHTHNLLFNDVKPDNIQMNATGDATSFALIDADSISCMLPEAPPMDDDRTGGYEAPEALNDHAVPASDTFALGMSVRQLARTRSEALEALLQAMCAPNHLDRPALTDIIRLAEKEGATGDSQA
jgi:serine/threonine protein kinase